jgi:predicted amidophosphoribosyltransferase
MQTLIKFACSGCGQKLLVDEPLSRSGVTCPNCAKALSVPHTHARLLAEILAGFVIFFFGIFIGIGSNSVQNSSYRERSAMPTFKGDKTGQPTQEDYDKAAQWLLDRDKEP